MQPKGNRQHYSTSAAEFLWPTYTVLMQAAMIAGASDFQWIDLVKTVDQYGARVVCGKAITICFWSFTVWCYRCR